MMFVAMWLKAKGDDFFRSKDYNSALAAYSEALEINPDLISYVFLIFNFNLFILDLSYRARSNKSACYLQLGRFKDCAEECTTTLGQLPDTPLKKQDEGNENESFIKKQRMKMKVLIRRGCAYCQLGHFR